MTVEARRDFARQMLALGLCHVQHQTAQGAPFRRVLVYESPIYRLTTFWDGRRHPDQPTFEAEAGEWMAIVARLELLQGAAFAERALAVLWPLAEPRVEEDAAAWPWIPVGYAAAPLPAEQVFGIFACEAPDAAGMVPIHIANACIPESPFADPAARVAELSALVDWVQKRWPTATHLGCNSWLNAFPPFQQFFPPSWPLAEHVAPLGISCNWWGQFVARDGGFHTRHGTRFRESGRFPYPAIDGACKLTALAAHLSAWHDDDDRSQATNPQAPVL
jgi:hypothetical protein